MDDATRTQIEAALPARSTWLTANAGSGKTRVLTGRVARLLLRGAPAQRILCLTYTRAAATEMQNRLLGQLGGWAMLGDADLRAALAAAGEDPATVDLAQARRLFARAIETPGGLKVQTIHAFCASVLRRFPLEAAVPVGFAEMDERTAAQMRAEVLDAMADADDPAIADLVALDFESDLPKVLAGLRAVDHAAPPDPDALWAGLGLPRGFDEAALIAEVMQPGDEALLARFADLTCGGNPKGDDARLAKAVRTILAGGRDLSMLAALEDRFLFGGDTKKAVPFSAKIDGIPTKALRAACADLLPALAGLMRRIEAARSRRLALRAAERTLRLQRFAHRFTTLYGAAKDRRGWLDFDDLITRTAALLADPAMAQWVLFRLDGGIDHILVDEAQDTSPAQWQVIAALTAEFTAGAGARAGDRTLFVVGDPKQSIYSFQGADIAEFEAAGRRFEIAFTAAPGGFARRTLRHSFRAAPLLLDLVDAAFAAGTENDGLGGAPAHVAQHAAMPGRIDLWAVPEAAGKPARGEWWRPDPTPAAPAPEDRLAAALAAAVRGMLGTPIRPVREAGWRPLDEGDVLILVQRRSTLFHALIRACKRAGLAVAGADRLKLAAERAVADIRAALSAVATPEDDLALATALRSPLFGLSEDDLYRLAAGRGGFLIERLRASAHDRARAVLADLMAQADFLSPHDLAARLLIRHGGRAALVGRLGPEAEDGIDELVAQALAFEALGPATLTGFLDWLGGDTTDIRRPVQTAAEGAAGPARRLLRVMTVHGAKGLESPVVILPDPPPASLDKEMLVRDPVLGPLWGRPKAERPDPVAARGAALERARAAENQRLLYVAMTRAESWLIVAATSPAATPDGDWHSRIAAAMDRLEAAGHRAVTLDQGDAPAIRRIEDGAWPAGMPAPTAAATRAADTDAAAAPTGSLSPPAETTGRPDWDTPPPRLPRPPRPLAATAIGGGAVPIGAATPVDADAPADARLFGIRLHRLLEVLPPANPAAWLAAAPHALAGTEGGAPDATEMAALLEAAGRVLKDPAVAAAMAAGPGETALAEVALTAPLPGGRVLSGVVDRLRIGPKRVAIIDYKSALRVPAAPDAVPPAFLRQMAAYRHAARAIWPGRAVEAAILWTAAPVLMPLPDALLDAAWRDVVADWAAPAAGVDPSGFGS